MRVGLYVGSYVFGGIKVSADNARKMLLMLGHKPVNPLKEDFDVLELHSVDPVSLYITRKAKKAGKKIILRAHTTIEDGILGMRGLHRYGKSLKRVYTFLYNIADLIIAPSFYTKSLLINNYKVKPPVYYLSNGVDSDFWKPENGNREEFRKQYNLDGKVVYCVSSLAHRKGVDDFVKVSELLPEYNFAWFGGFPSLMDRNSKNKDFLKSKVLFTGRVDDILSAHLAGDVFFLPTREENEGIPVLEAMRVGKPCVLRDIPAFDRYEEGVTALKGSSVEDFADKISLAFKSDDLVRKAFKLSQDYCLSNLSKEYSKILDLATPKLINVSGQGRVGMV